MNFLEKYGSCDKCPVEKFCGTMCMSVRLCNSYEEEETPEEETPEAEWEMLQDAGAMDLEDLNL